MNLLTISLAIFFIGVFLLAWSGANFDWRAVRNKRAWNGWTLPLLSVGLPLAIIGLVMIWATFPR